MIGSFLPFWGKARPSAASAGPGAHPAAHHMLDVAACAELLLPSAAPGIDAAHRPLALFLVALHDIGKFTRSFQALAPAQWPARILGEMRAPPNAERHDTLGYRILTGPLWPELQAMLPGWRAAAIQPLLRAVTGHHGRPPLERAEPLQRDIFCPACHAAASQLLAALRDLLLPASPPPLRGAEAANLSWSLAGLATLADWLGSSPSAFPYTAPLPGGIAEYWALARRHARATIAASGVLPARSAPALTMRDLFGAELTPTPVQSWAGDLALPAGPILALIEDVTGSGKTEAAILLAHRLIAAGRADGLFFALPTMATADAMFARLAAAYRRLFAEEARPSLVLAHGRRALHAGFHDAVLRGLGPDPKEAGEAPAGAECAAWIAEDRRLAFLADVGAGTIDQAFLGVLPSRHAALRLLGLSRRVLIVDEAHAYDSYMRGELAALLRFQATLGGSAIVLSATLPKAQRAALAGAFAKGLGAQAPVLSDTSYPLVTLVSGDGGAEFARGTRAESRRQVAMRRIGDEAAALDALMAAHRGGAAAVWIRNTVDDAIAAAEALRARGVVPLLFHARFAMGDRQAIQAEVLRLFGKHSVPGERARVLVATQVVEQSLDLDFDVMVSDLAPVDLLVQRAGRLWRHPQRKRPVTAAELLVLSPEPVADPPADWVRALLPGTAVVYPDPALLWRGARALFSTGSIVTPGGVRGLIEAAYAPEGEVPPALATQQERAQGTATAHGNLAHQNVLQLEKGYQHDNGAWDSDIVTPTRIGDATTTFRLARLVDREVVPWCAGLDPDPMRAWALSEVALRSARASEAVVPDGAAAAVERAKATWPEWDRAMPVLLLLAGDDGTLCARVRSPDGQISNLLYQSKVGLIFPKRN